MSSQVLSLPIFREADQPSDLLIAHLHPKKHCREDRPLPMSAKEMRERGWDEIDIVFVTGDAYIDHPSFAMAFLRASAVAFVDSTTVVTTSS